MKFIVTKELGKLARWLRILGFDTVYYDKANYATLVIIALRDQRTIITRSKKEIDKLPQNSLLIISEDILEQIKEVIEKLKLRIDEEKMFSRCTICNEFLIEVKKDKIKDLVPEYVYNHQDFFMQCPQCRRIYWQGSHWGNVTKIINNLGLK
ncbi:MAG: Mut7-C RNAse domain-containing protein [Candidatus Omnitrophica bacterium]|nr:Mut7-C RNAse domain-containing protein [Candidatus Omnitrophota bacterium]MCM8831869.1 Mut7-C RNAse domain-containing protein [Candidatus Omnitrophota bacterium]